MEIIIKRFGELTPYELYTILKLRVEVYARKFYEKAGFIRTSEPFDEDGIPHIRMRREPDR